MAASRTGGQLLWRVPKNRKLLVQARLTDGSCLSRIEPAPPTRKQMDEDAQPLTVRVIDYRLPGVPDAEPVYRLINTLLDPAIAPAQELATLYQSCWTIETTFAEIKTTLKGADVVLRSKSSKTPELVRQEFWGMLLASCGAQVDARSHAGARTCPACLEFQHSLTLMRLKLPASAPFPQSSSRGGGRN